MPKPNQVQRTPTAHEAKVFHQVNPIEIFSGLDEIGHGSFGAVYKATKEGRDVAIKMMKIPGGFGSDEWADIYKEILFLSEIEHDNIIGYYGAYQHELTVWLVMEYAVGSCQDVMDVFKNPLQENEIGAIVTPCLKALEYLHLKGRIHRDVKAGNILLTEEGSVKLADFGSGSTKVPANSLIGTPYWMAPEMIMAMETGTYGTGVDIWSLGITCIELAERRPPLFALNAMTALYHIPQKDPPQLSEPAKFSSGFVDFVREALKKKPDERPSATSLLEHEFARVQHRKDVVFKLVERTTDPELLQNNATAVAKVLDAMAIVTGQKDTESEAAGSDSPSPVPVPAKEPVDRDVSTRPASRSDSSTGRPSLGSITEEKQYQTIQKETALQEARTNRYINQQGNQNNQVAVSQLKEIQKIRKEQAKVLEVMTSRHEAECSKLEAKADQGLESAMKSREKDLEKHLARCRVEKEVAEKARVTEEQKFWKSRKDVRSKTRSSFKKTQASRVKASKAGLKSEKGSMTKTQLKEQLDQLMKGHATSKARDADQLESKLDGEDAVAHLEHQLTQLPQVHSMLFRHLQVEVELLIRNNETTLAVKTKRLDALKTVYNSFVTDWTTTVQKGVRHLEEVEMRQANMVCVDTLRAKKKSHLAELKSQPKTLKQTTQRIKKDYDNTIRGTQRKFKEFARKTAGELPKGEQQRSIKLQKAEKESQITKLEEEYQEKLTEMIDSTTAATAKRHKEEIAQIEAGNAAELAQLTQYQGVRRKKTASQLEKISATYRKRVEKEEAEHEKFITQIEKENLKQKSRMAVIQTEQAQELMMLQQRLSDQRSQLLT